MSFSSDVKAELCKRLPEDMTECCRRAELAGIVAFAAKNGGSELRIVTEHVSVAKRVYMLYKSLYGDSLAISIKKTPRRTNHTYAIIFSKAACLNTVYALTTDNIAFRLKPAVVANNCCKRSFLRGAFLGGGSISAPEHSYHCEIKQAHFTMIEGFTDLLEALELPFHTAHRKSIYLYYLKDSEAIGDFLTVIGASSKMMELLNIKIWKEMRNTTNRLVNAENANIDKTVNAAQRQITAINKLLAANPELDPLLYEVARVRLANPSLSLSELGQALNPQLSKSAVNNRMKRLLKMSEDY